MLAILAKGPVAKTKIEEAAKAEGIAERTLRRVKRELKNIIAKKMLLTALDLVAMRQRADQIETRDATAARNAKSEVNLGAASARRLYDPHKDDQAPEPWRSSFAYAPVYLRYLRRRFASSLYDIG